MQAQLDMAQLTRLRMALGRLGRVLRQQAVDGLSYPQVSLLFTVERLHPVTPGALANAEAITPPAITRSLNELEQLGLVTRDRDAADRRVSRVRLTDAGRRECSRIRQSRNVWLAERVTRLSAEDVELLVAALPALDRLCESPPV